MIVIKAQSSSLNSSTDEIKVSFNLVDPCPEATLEFVYPSPFVDQDYTIGNAVPDAQ